MTPVQYKFTNLGDIKIGEQYNVIAVVKYFQNAEKTRGTGYKMTISITDPSLGYDNKLTCNIFNDHPENLPRISSRGDVIIIHRLKIGSYKDKPQGTGTHKLGFASAVFCREDSAKLISSTYEQVSDLIKSGSAYFNITQCDFEQVKQMMVWADDMPQSQKGEGYDEINMDAFQFSTLSVISLGEMVSLAVQIISIVTVDYPPYQTILLVWDATKPSYILNKNFISYLSTATSVKHCIHMMAKFGGKISNPYLTCVLLKETLMELKQSFIRPGDYVYLSRVTISSSNNGPGIILVGDQCQIGNLPQEFPLYAELTDRLHRFTRHTLCVADCISNDIKKLESFHLQDYCKMLEEISNETKPLNTSYAFKITTKVASVHPSNVKEFYDSLLLYCTCCQRFYNEDSSQGENIEPCQNNFVPIPMITVILEDFTGWLTCIIAGKAALDLMRLVMIDATKPEWWTHLLRERDPQIVQTWLSHIYRLNQGYMEGKLIFRRGCDGSIIPFIEDVVILDY